MAKIKYCVKCGCMLFPGEIMCPDCLTPVKNQQRNKMSTCRICGG